MNHECHSKAFPNLCDLEGLILAVTNAKEDMHMILCPFVRGYVVPGYVVSQARCSKVPACAFPPGKEASDDGYLRGAPIGSGEGGTNVGKGLLIAYVSIAKVV